MYSELYNQNSVCFQESVELLVIKTRGSDGGDSGPRDEDVAQLCWRCRRHAPPLTSAVCMHCNHAFAHSLATHGKTLLCMLLVNKSVELSS